MDFELSTTACVCERISVDISTSGASHAKDVGADVAAVQRLTSDEHRETGSPRPTTHCRCVLRSDVTPLAIDDDVTT